MDPVTLKPTETPPGIPADFAAALAAAGAGWFASKEVVRPSTILDEKRSSSVRTIHPGWSRTFNGVNQYVNCGDVPQISGAGALSVFAWIKPSAATVGDICSKFSASTPLRAFRLIRLAGGQIRAFVCDDGTGSPGHYKQKHTNATVPAGAWAHVGFVFNGTGSTLKIFINGVDQALTIDVDDPITTIVSTTEPMIIGAYKGGIESWFTGSLFDVRVYTRALSDAEVLAMYNTTRIASGDPINSVSSASLVRHYRLDDIPSRTGGSVAPLDSSLSAVHAAGVNQSTAIQTDVSLPISYCNETGHNDLTVRGWPSAWPDLHVEPRRSANWTAAGSGGATTVLLNQTWNGRSGVVGIKFAAGAASGFSVNRANQIVSGNNLFAPLGRLLCHGADVSMSRPIKSSENISLYWTGGLSMPQIIFTSNYTWTDWRRTWSSNHVFASSPEVYPVVYVYSGTIAEDIVFYIDLNSVAMLDQGAYSSSGLLVAMRYPDSAVPASSSNPAVDVFGSALLNTGEAQRVASLTDSGCVTLDGLNDRLDLSSSLSLTPPYTISCWVYRAASADAMLVVDGAASTGLRILSDKPIAYFGASNYRYFANTIVNNTWTHLAISVPTGNASDCTCYVDGVVNQASSLHTGTANLTLSSIGSTAPINGRMADVRIFTRDLSQSEIQDVMNDRTTAPVAIEHWPLAEMAANTSYSVGAGGRTLAHVNTTEASVWANRQPKVHYNQTRGYRNPTANGTYRTSDGVRQRWSISGASTLRMGTDKWWVACYLRPGVLAATRTIAGTWGPDREWLVQLTSANLAAISLSSVGSSYTGGLTISGTTVDPSVWSLVFFGIDLAVSPALKGAINNNSFQTQTYPNSNIWNGSGQFGVAAATSGSEFYLGDIGFISVGKAATTLDFTAIRSAIWNSGTPLTYSQLTAQQKTDWGLVSWWDGSRLDRSFVDVHGANTLAPTGIPYVPARLSADLAGDGGAITHRPGAYHNDAETKIDFTSGVSTAPWLEGLSIPTAYTNNSTLPGAMTRRRAQNAGGVVVEDRYTATG